MVERQRNWQLIGSNSGQLSQNNGNDTILNLYIAIHDYSNL